MRKIAQKATKWRHNSELSPERGDLVIENTVLEENIHLVKIKQTYCFLAGLTGQTWTFCVNCCALCVCFWLL